LIKDVLTDTQKLLARRAYIEAEPQLAQYVDQNPYNAEGYRQLAICQFERNDYVAGLRNITTAIGIEPNFGSHYTALGCAQMTLNQWDAAEETTLRALELSPLQPLAMWNLAMIRLRNGDWESGWKLYEWGVGCGCRPFRTLLPRFDGTQQSVMIWAEQGLGDTVMFSQLLHKFKEEYPQVDMLLEVPVQLLNLFINSFPEFNVTIKPSDSSVPVLVDSQISLASIPFHLELKSPADLDKPKPYLHPRDYLVAAIGQAFQNRDKLSVGIFWQGATIHANDHNRSMTAEDVDKLLALTDVNWFTLQADLPTDRPLPQTEMRQINNSLVDAEHTAALILNLDCVVTVDSFVAHLAGALGKETYLLLPFNSEWRWGVTEECIWYPNVKFIKQSSPGDWTSCITLVHQILKEKSVKFQPSSPIDIAIQSTD